MRLRSCIAAHKKSAACTVSASRATSASSVTSRTVYRRTVADSRSATGSIAAVSRAVPSSTRACTSGCFAFSWRSVAARRRSTIWRFSASVVGSVSPRRRPSVSRYVTRAFDEHLLDVAPREKLAQRSELRDRTQHPLRHLRRVTQRHLVAEPSATLIVVDRALDLDPHFADLGGGLQPPPLDPGDRVASDDVVRVGPDGHEVASGAASIDESRGRASTWSASSATARLNAPRPTAVPAHAASVTRRSVGTNRTSHSGRLFEISS